MKLFTFQRILFASLLAAATLAGCGKEEKEDISVPQTEGLTVKPMEAASTPAWVPSGLPPWQDPLFADFKLATHENIQVYYPTGHVHEAQMAQAPIDYKKAIAKISETLGLPEPTDTIRIFVLTGPGQGRTLTGDSFPHGDSLAVYYWPNYSRGPSLMQHLLYKYFGDWSQHRIMNHGLIALFDFAGENHHETTLEYLREGKFIPLGKPVDDTLMNSTIERYQSSEAGSFVAFLLAQHGIAGVEAVYRAPLPFAYAVQSSLSMSVDSLQKEWIAFIEAAIGPIDTTTTK